MDDLISFILDAWVEYWQVIVPVLIFAVLVKSPYGEIWKSEADRKKWIGALIQNRGQQRYRQIMGQWLDRLDGKLSQPQLDQERGPIAVAWSPGLLDILVSIAMIYPILMLATQWIAGFELVLGGQLIAVPGPTGSRTITGIWLLSAIVFFFGGKLKNKILRRVILVISATGFIVGYMSMPYLEIPRDVVFLGTIFYIYFVANSVSVAFSITVATSIAASVDSNAIILLGIFFVAAELVRSVAIRVERNNPSPTPQVIAILILLALSTLIIMVAWQPLDRPWTQYLIVFVFIFPVCNLIADFASVGLTRHLLRQGLENRTWLKSIVDAFGGALIFLALGCAIITYLHLVIPADGVPLLNLSGVFNDLETRPMDMWWLFFMLFSTLIPTALHGMVGVFTLLISYPAPLRRWVVGKLDAGGAGRDTDGWQGSMAICAMITASIWVPILVLWYAFTANHGWLLGQIIAVFRGYAQLIGAI